MWNDEDNNPYSSFERNDSTSSAPHQEAQHHGMRSDEKREPENNVLAEDFVLILSTQFRLRALLYPYVRR